MIVPREVTRTLLSALNPDQKRETKRRFLWGQSPWKQAQKRRRRHTSGTIYRHTVYMVTYFSSDSVLI